MQPEEDSEFWRDMPRYIYIGLTESDEGLFGRTVRMAARLLKKCRDSSVPWPIAVEFDEGHMYLTWLRSWWPVTEITVWQETLHIDELYAIGPGNSMAHVVTHLSQWATADKK